MHEWVAEDAYTYKLSQNQNRGIATNASVKKTIHNLDNYISIQKS